MAPMKLKQPPTLTAQSMAATGSQDARLLVRETLRISANLASTSSPSSAMVAGNRLRDEVANLGLLGEGFVDSSLRLICCEGMDGWRWNYFAENEGEKQFKKGSIRAVSLQRPRDPREELISFVRSYVVLEGFPDNVTESYVPYMT